MKQPVIDPTARILAGAIVTGEVTLGAHSSVWHHAVLRGDSGGIFVQEGANIQDCCILHAGRRHPVVVQKNASVGHGCILHGCTVGAGALVGMGSIVMDGAELGAGCIVGAGSLVVEGTVIPAGMLAFGRPARVVRPLTDAEKDENLLVAQEYIQLAQEA